MGHYASEMDGSPGPRPDQAVKAETDTRTCTCHPDDRPEPCQRKFATNHCWRSAVYNDARLAVIGLKNRDRSPAEQEHLNYLMRVERALDGTF
jgi:hypothetical protein